MPRNEKNSHRTCVWNSEEYLVDYGIKRNNIFLMIKALLYSGTSVKFVFNYLTHVAADRHTGTWANILSLDLYTEYHRFRSVYGGSHINIVLNGDDKITTLAFVIMAMPLTDIC